MITVPNSVGNELHVEFTSHDGHKIQSNGIMGDTIAIKSLSGLHPGTTGSTQGQAKQAYRLCPGTNYTVRAFIVEGSTQGQAKVTTVTTVTVKLKDSELIQGPCKPLLHHSERWHAVLKIYRSKYVYTVESLRHS
jgi:hypothetical protein